MTGVEIIIFRINLSKLSSAFFSGFSLKKGRDTTVFPFIVLPKKSECVAKSFLPRAKLYKETTCNLSLLVIIKSKNPYILRYGA
jgi:hypothetical protein